MYFVPCQISINVNNRNTRTRCEICSKLAIKTTINFFIVKFEHISHLVLVFLLLTLSRQLPVGLFRTCKHLRWNVLWRKILPLGRLAGFWIRPCISETFVTDLTNVYVCRLWKFKYVHLILNFFQERQPCGPYVNYDGKIHEQPWRYCCWSNTPTWRREKQNRNTTI